MAETEFNLLDEPWIRVMTKDYEIKEIEDGEEFKLLQCNEKKELGLVIISPFQVEKEYEIKITDEIIKNLRRCISIFNSYFKFRSKENYSKLKGSNFNKCTYWVSRAANYRE